MTTRLLRTAPGFSSSEQTITKAKKPLVITAKEIEAEGTTENKIPESDLSLPEVIKKLTTQTIEAEKKFETPQPAEVSGLTGTASAKPIFVKGGQGGNTSSTTTGTGGGSANLSFETGAGGEAKLAKTTSTGGSSGQISFTVGAPGNGGITGGEKGVGGKAGNFTFSGLLGGNANAETTVSNKGGLGSGWLGQGGGGGQAQNSLGTNTGGNGGEVVLVGGPGGAAKGGVKAIAGNAAKVKIETAAGGVGSGASETNTNGLGGPVQIVLGTGGGNEEAKSGPLEVRYKEAAGPIRLYIHPEGNVGIGNTSTPGAKLEVLGTGIYTGLLSAKAGLTVEGTLTLPGESITETFIKAEVITAGKIATGAVTETKLGAEAVTASKIATNAVEEAKIKAEAVTAGKIATNAVEAAKIKAEAVETGKIKLLAVTEGTIAEEAVSGKKIKTGTPEAAKELKAATKIKGITGSSTMVYISALLKAEATTGEIIADGKKIYALLTETLAASSKVLYFSFKMKAGAEFELKFTTGGLEGTTSVYVLQEG